MPVRQPCVPKGFPMDKPQMRSIDQELRQHTSQHEQCEPTPRLPQGARPIVNAVLKGTHWSLPFDTPLVGPLRGLHQHKHLTYLSGTRRANATEDSQASRDRKQDVQPPPRASPSSHPHTNARDAVPGKIKQIQHQMALTPPEPHKDKV